MNTKTYIIAINENGLQFHKVDVSYIEKYRELWSGKIYFIVPIEEFVKKLIDFIL